MAPPSAPSCLSKRIARRVGSEEPWPQYRLEVRCGPVQDVDELPGWECNMGDARDGYGCDFGWRGSGRWPEGEKALLCSDYALVNSTMEMS